MRLFGKNNEIVPVTDNKIAVVENTPAAMLAVALKNDATIEQMERLYDLQLKFEQNEARKAYTAAMAAFKENPPEIFKDKKVDYTSKKTGHRTRYDHASLGNVTNTINSELGKHGLSASWIPEQPDGQVKITCIITHTAGHSESSSLIAPPDGSGNKNTIQAINSTVSYLERYTLLALTGLATMDMDDDGRSYGKQQDSENPTISKEQEQIDKYIKAIDSFLEEENGLEMLDKWIEQWKDEICKLSEIGKSKIRSYIRQVRKVIVTDPNAPPKTIVCPEGMGPVTITDCEQCPKHNDCQPSKEF